MVRLWLVMAVGVAFLIASGVIASAGRTQPSVDPGAVISAYESARNQQDLDTALSYFADNATLTQRNSTITGKDQIRKYLTTVSARARYVVVSDRHTSGNVVSWTERGGVQATAPTTRLPGFTGGPPNQQQLGRPGVGGGQTVTGPNATTPSGTGANATGQNAAGPNATGTPAPQGGFVVTVDAVVQDGKIQSMSYTFGAQAQRPDPALEGRAPLPAGLGLGAVVALLAGIVLIASTGGRTARVNSRLQGQLLQGLQGWSAARE